MRTCEVGLGMLLADRAKRKLHFSLVSSTVLVVYFGISVICTLMRLNSDRQTHTCGLWQVFWMVRVMRSTVILHLQFIETMKLGRHCCRTSLAADQAQCATCPLKSGSWMLMNWLLLTTCLSDAVIFWGEALDGQSKPLSSAAPSTSVPEVQHQWTVPLFLSRSEDTEKLNGECLSWPCHILAHAAYWIKTSFVLPRTLRTSRRVQTASGTWSDLKVKQCQAMTGSCQHFSSLVQPALPMQQMWTRRSRGEQRHWSCGHGKIRRVFLASACSCFAFSFLGFFKRAEQLWEFLFLIGEATMHLCSWAMFLTSPNCFLACPQHSRTCVVQHTHTHKQSLPRRSLVPFLFWGGPTFRKICE